MNFPAEFLDDETNIHYELIRSSSGTVLLCTVPHSFPNTFFSVLFTNFCISLLTLPAAVVHQRVTRRKLTVVGSPRGSRRNFPQERRTVLHLLTITSRYNYSLSEKSLLFRNAGNRAVALTVSTLKFRYLRRNQSQ